MKALVIAPQPFFTPRGTPFSVYYRTLVSSQMGVKVDLLTYGEGQDVSIPNTRIIRIPRFKSLGHVKIGPSLLKLFLDVFIVLWTVYLLIRNKYDVVHAHEEAIFFCIFLRPIFRFKLIYDMHSSLPQQLTNFKFTQSKILIGLFKKLEDASIQRSDAVITICPDLADYVNGVIKDRSRHLLIENSIFDVVNVIPSGESGGRAGEASSDTVLVDLPENKRLIVYAGTLESYQGIDILIKAFRGVLKEIPDAYLMIVGGSQEQVQLYSQKAQEEGIEGSVQLTGRVPQALAKAYCKAAEVQLSPRSSGTNTPLKIYEQLAGNIPLVATNIYSHTQVLDSSVAYLVDPTPDGLSSGIIAALSDSEQSKLIARNARKLYDEKYSRPVYEQKMKAVLDLVRN